MNVARTARGLGALTLTTDDAKMTYSYVMSATSYFNLYGAFGFTGINAAYSTYSRYDSNDFAYNSSGLALVSNNVDLASSQFYELNGYRVEPIDADYFLKYDFMNEGISDMCICFAASLNTLDSVIMPCYDSFLTPKDLACTYNRSCFFKPDTLVTSENYNTWNYDGSDNARLLADYETNGIGVLPVARETPHH